MSRYQQVQRHQLRATEAPGVGAFAPGYIRESLQNSANGKAKNKAHLAYICLMMFQLLACIAFVIFASFASEQNDTFVTPDSAANKAYSSCALSMTTPEGEAKMNIINNAGLNSTLGFQIANFAQTSRSEWKKTMTAQIVLGSTEFAIVLVMFGVMFAWMSENAQEEQVKAKTGFRTTFKVLHTIAAVLWLVLIFTAVFTFGGLSASRNTGITCTDSTGTAIVLFSDDTAKTGAAHDFEQASWIIILVVAIAIVINTVMLLMSFMGLNAPHIIGNDEYASEEVENDSEDLLPDAEARFPVRQFGASAHGSRSFLSHPRR